MDKPPPVPSARDGFPNLSAAHFVVPARARLFFLRAGRL